MKLVSNKCWHQSSQSSSLIVTSSSDFVPDSSPLFVSHICLRRISIAAASDWSKSHTPEEGTGGG